MPVILEQQLVVFMLVYLEGADISYFLHCLNCLAEKIMSFLTDKFRVWIMFIMIKLLCISNKGLLYIILSAS